MLVWQALFQLSHPWSLVTPLFLFYFFSIFFSFLGNFVHKCCICHFHPSLSSFQHVSCSSSQTDDLSFIIFIKYLSINKRIPYWFHLVLLMCTCLCDLELYNLPGGSSLEKTDLLSPRCYWLSRVLHLGVRSFEISLIHVGMSTGFVMHILLR